MFVFFCPEMGAMSLTWRVLSLTIKPFFLIDNNNNNNMTYIATVKCISSYIFHSIVLRSYRVLL